MAWIGEVHCCIDPVQPFAEALAHDIADIINGIDIVACTATHHICARAAIQAIIACIADQDIVVALINQDVGSDTALQRILAVPAPQRVITACAQDDVVLAVATQGLACNSIPEQRIAITEDQVRLTAASHIAAARCPDEQIGETVIVDVATLAAADAKVQVIAITIDYQALVFTQHAGIDIRVKSILAAMENNRTPIVGKAIRRPC